MSSNFERELHAGIALGPPRANRKPVLQLLTPDGTPVAFVKVGVNELTRKRVRHETEALRMLNTLSLGTLSLPELIEVPRWGITDCITTHPVRTWTQEGVDPLVRGQALRDLVAAMKSESHLIAESPWWRRLSTRLDSLGANPEADVLRSCMATLESRIGESPILHGAAHGDWSPWNVSTDRGSAVAWDWERFSTDSPVGLDALHFSSQEEIRLRGASPRDGLLRVLAHAPELVMENGAQPTLGLPLFILYLLQLGEQYLADGQQEAGSRRGPLSDWLLPALENAIADLG